jgi:hypothetical protein
MSLPAPLLFWGKEDVLTDEEISLFPLPARYFSNSHFTAAIPLPGNPIRLMTASSSTSRKTRGFGLPACGRGVTVPISRCPNPNAANPRTPMPSLSYPAASPTGFLNRKPSTSTGFSIPANIACSNQRVGAIFPAIPTNLRVSP